VEREGGHITGNKNFDIEKRVADARKVALKYFVYDKELRKIFRISNGLDLFEARWHDLALLRNKPAFNQWTMTMNHDYAARLWGIEFLVEHYNELPAALKAIVKGAKIDDNPVLMLMKFK